MKAIAQLEVGETRVAVPHAVSLLRNAAAVTLMYSRDHADRLKAWREAELAAFGEREEKLIARLDVSFLDEIFVKRDEISELSELLALRKLIILRGDRGAGKSTAMYWLQRHFPSSEHDRLISIDLNEHRSDPELRPDDDYAADEGIPKETVCDIIYREVFLSVLGEQASQSHADSWTLYLLRNSAAYFQLYESILSTSRPRPTGDSEFLGALAADRYAGKHLEASDAFSAQQGTARLYFLLRFCLEVLNIRFTVFIDNIDQVKHEIQQDVVDRCMDLSAVMTPVVAVRNANYHRLAISNRGAETYIVKVFTAKDQPNRRKELQSQIEEPEEAALQASEHILTRFIRRRLTVALDAYRGWSTEDSALLGLAEALGYGGSLEDFLSEHLQVLNRIAHDLSHSRTVSACLEWHNGSLRTSGSQIFNIVNSLVMDKDPFFRYPLILAKPGVDRPNPRELRTMTYRHLVFMGRTPKMEAPRVINIFDGTSSAPEGPRALRFFPLKVLEYLSGRIHARTTWGHLRDGFSSALISPGDLFQEVERLAAPRGSIPDGYIYLDVDPLKIEYPLPDDLVIELLPSGRFFLERLSVSVEYLFWMALYTDCDVQLFEDREKRLKAHELTDELRAETAIRFLEGYILPRFKDEVDEWAQDPEQSHLSYWKLFGRGSRGFYPERAAGGIQGFLNRSSVRGGRRSSLHARTEKVRVMCEAVWDDSKPLS